MVVQALPALRPVLLAASCAILALYGLKMMHVLRGASVFGWMDRSIGVRTTAAGSDGALRNLLLGAIFGSSWTPCAGPILGGVLTYAAAGDDGVVDGGALLLAYAAGVAAPLFLVAAAAERVTPYLRSVLPYTRAIEAVSGIVLVVVGLRIGAQVVDVSELPWARGARADLERQAITEGADAAGRAVFFHSEHCPTCRAMQRFLPALAEACRSKRWRLESVDVDRPENRPLVERFGVRAVPTLSLLDAAGAEVEHLVGYQAPGDLRRAIERTMVIACAADVPEGDDLDQERDGACTVQKPC